MSPKEDAIERLQSLPDNADWRDIHHAITSGYKHHDKGDTAADFTAISALVFIVLGAIVYSFTG